MDTLKSSFKPSEIHEFPTGEVLSLFGCSDEYSVFPGFCDVHVHFREPGFSYKETIRTGTRSAARGGYTAVCTMPNLSPVPDSAEHLLIQQRIIENDACIHVYPYAAITVGQQGEQLCDFSTLSGAVAFSDDGHGVQSAERMEQAMVQAKKLGKQFGTLQNAGYYAAAFFDNDEMKVLGDA